VSQPSSYSPAHAFVSDAATISNFPGQQLDFEFSALKTTTDQIRTNLALIQRDDGALLNGVVTYDSLSASVQSNGLAPANAWATGTLCTVGTAVLQNYNLYRCAVAHTAGTFATDLAAGKWTFVIALPVAAMPMPAPTVLGGVFSHTATTHQFVTAINTDGTVTTAQPAFTDISGTLAAAQLPAPTTSTLGGVKAATVVAHSFVSSIGTDGAPGMTQPVAADVSFTQTGTGATAITEDTIWRKIYTPEMFGAVSSPLGTAAGSLTNNQTAINAAITALGAIGGGTLLFGPGAYSVGNGISVASSNVFLKGAGMHATTLVLVPTVPTSAVQFGNAGIIGNNGISDMTVGSSDTTTTKNGITLIDTTQFTMRNVIVDRYPQGNGILAATSGAVGLSVQGRELGLVENCQFYANLPIQISQNPHAVGTASIVGLNVLSSDPLPAGTATIPPTATYSAISGAWTAYTPTLVSLAGGAIGTGNTLTGQYRQDGKTISIRVNITIGASGMGSATQAGFSLPVTAASGGAILVGKSTTTGAIHSGDIPTGGLTNALISSSTGGAAANSNVYVFSGVYEAA
jgi:hypothetical protein